MNRVRRIEASAFAEIPSTGYPKTFSFFHAKVGVRMFEVKAEADGSMPMDRAAGLLAVHCLMRKQAPSDFLVMVMAADDLLDAIRQRAKTLIKAFPVPLASIRLTGRQDEVLRGVLQSLSNRQIGMKLHISTRTAKFHVASLLAKFGVTRRSSLMRLASEYFPVSEISN